MRSRPVLFTTLAFALVGPLTGVVFWLVFTIAQASHADSKLEMPQAAEALGLVGWAYFFCCIPAAATGLIWAAALPHLVDRLRSGVLVRAIFGAAIGATVSAAWGFAVVSILTGMAGFFAGYGALAGAILAAVFPRPQWLAPSSNNRWRGP